MAYVTNGNMYTNFRGIQLVICRPTAFHFLKLAKMAMLECAAVENHQQECIKLISIVHNILAQMQ